jgi:hypothetical protein
MARKFNPLFENIPFEIIEWKEIEEAGAKKFRVKGVFNRADERNANNRIYPAKLVEREHRKLQERIAKQDESTFMQADHPSDGISRIRDTTAIMRGVNYDPVSKKVIGEADIVPTSLGRDLQEIIRAGGKVGISARGFGTTAPGEHAGQKGDVVQEDYQLVTYDFVVGQSTRGAVITNFEEQARMLAGMLEEEEMDIKTLKLEDLKTARPDLFSEMEQNVTKTVKADMTKTVAEAVAAKTTEIENALIARLEWGSDGKVRKDGEVIKLKKTAGGKDGDRGEEDPGPHVTTEEQLRAAADKLGFKVEKKGKKKDEEDDEEEMDEKKLREHAEKLGLTVAKKGETFETEVVNLRTRLTELNNSFQTNNQMLEEMKKRNQENAVRDHIFEVTTTFRSPIKNALIERLLKAGCKTVEEVDAKLPLEKQAIEKLLIESSGGSALAGQLEEIGNGGGEKKFKVKKGDGTIVEMTQTQVLERGRAGLSTEIVNG